MLQDPPLPIHSPNKIHDHDAVKTFFTTASRVVACVARKSKGRLKRLPAGTIFRHSVPGKRTRPRRCAVTPWRNAVSGFRRKCKSVASGVHFGSVAKLRCGGFSIGRATVALDVPSKVNGKGRYGLDAAVSGMIYARPKIPPTRYDSKVVAIDDSAARRLPGYLKSIALEDPSGTVPGWVMVLADSFIVANRAADLVKVAWSSGKGATVSERDIQHRASELIADPMGGSLLVDDAGVDAAFRSAKQKIERTYTTGTAMHVALEPVNALAFEKDGIFEIHTGNQWQTLILPVLAKALGRSQDKIVLRSYLLGGAFGRRLDGDYAVPAALAAQAMGKPVKMVFT